MTRHKSATPPNGCFRLGITILEAVVVLSLLSTSGCASTAGTDSKATDGGPPSTPAIDGGYIYIDDLCDGIDWSGLGFDDQQLSELETSAFEAAADQGRVRCENTDGSSHKTYVRLSVWTYPSADEAKSEFNNGLPGDDASTELDAYLEVDSPWKDGEVSAEEIDSRMQVNGTFLIDNLYIHISFRLATSDKDSTDLTEDSVQAAMSIADDVREETRV